MGIVCAKVSRVFSTVGDIQHCENITSCLRIPSVNWNGACLVMCIDTISTFEVFNTAEGTTIFVKNI